MWLPPQHWAPGHAQPACRPTWPPPQCADWPAQQRQQQQSLGCSCTPCWLVRAPCACSHCGQAQPWPVPGPACPSLSAPAAGYSLAMPALPAPCSSGASWQGAPECSPALGPQQQDPLLSLLEEWVPEPGWDLLSPASKPAATLDKPWALPAASHLLDGLLPATGEPPAAAAPKSAASELPSPQQTPAERISSSSMPTGKPPRLWLPPACQQTGRAWSLSGLATKDPSPGSQLYKGWVQGVELRVQGSQHAVPGRQAGQSLPAHRRYLCSHRRRWASMAGGHLMWRDVHAACSGCEPYRACRAGRAAEGCQGGDCLRLAIRDLLWEGPAIRLGLRHLHSKRAPLKVGAPAPDACRACPLHCQGAPRACRVEGCTGTWLPQAWLPCSPCLWASARCCHSGHAANGLQGRAGLCEGVHTCKALRKCTLSAATGAVRPAGLAGRGRQAGPAAGGAGGGPGAFLCRSSWRCHDQVRAWMLKDCMTACLSHAVHSSPLVAAVNSILSVACWLDVSCAGSAKAPKRPRRGAPPKYVFSSAEAALAHRCAAAACDVHVPVVNL